MSRVLIVDDDTDHAESLADVIEMRGHEVQMARTGEEGVACFRDQGPFDFVLMDVKLPGMNGVDTFLELRKINPAARVMMMTGFSVEQLVAQAIEGGALGVLHKPFPATHILELLVKVKPPSRVLIADDDPDFVESIVPILQKVGYDVRVARTGAEALDKMLEEQIDCLLLDLRMPVMSGAELYARLMEAGRTVPTILVSEGREAAEDARLRKTCGMLFKPFDPNALLSAIESAVSLGRTDR